MSRPVVTRSTTSKSQRIDDSNHENDNHPFKIWLRNAQIEFEEYKNRSMLDRRALRSRFETEQRQKQQEQDLASHMTTRKRNCTRDYSDNANNSTFPEEERGIETRKKLRLLGPIDNNQWMAMYKKLIAYKTENNSTAVPQRYDKDPKLGYWVMSQRSLYKKNRLVPDRIDLLNSIDFVWVIKTIKDEEHWKLMYEKLVAYKTEHKNTNVPTKYDKDPELGNWVMTQRVKYNRKQILQNRRELLDSINFVWNESRAINEQKQWMAMFDELVAYKNQHDNTSVPTKYDKDPKLGQWVSTQRTIYNKKRLSPDRIKLLNSIAFVWGFRAIKEEEQWMHMYGRLVEYKNKYNHTLVPQSCIHNPQLGRWVVNQRSLNKRCKLTKNRIYLLNSIGFIWDAKQN